MTGYLDVHQHVWPAGFVEALRRRAQPPCLRGWTLHTAGEAPFEVRPRDHDVASRRAAEAGAAEVLVSLSSPLGIEHLPPAEAAPLLDAWHEGIATLGAPFAGWASVNHVEPDLDQLKALLVDTDAVRGLQVPAGELATPQRLESLAPVLRACEELDAPVLVHPGPAAPVAGVPPWWPAVVDYPAQLQAAWWSWREAGRGLLPGLRICFAAGAGLAPAHHERFAARAAPGRQAVDRDAFVETSSYGRQGVDALIRALGIDVIVLGSDRPYSPTGYGLPADGHCADPAGPEAGDGLGAAARHAIHTANPARLLRGDRP